MTMRKKFLEEENFPCSPFHFTLRILQETCSNKKEGGERLKDLTAKTINIYYRDIKTEEYSLLFA